MEEKKVYKSKNIFIITILIIFILALLVYNASHYKTYHAKEIINITSPNAAIDYQKLYNLHLSGDFSPSIWDINYNLENYSLEAYAQKQIKIFTELEKISEQKFITDTAEILKVDFSSEYEENVTSITSYYFVKTNNVIITLSIYYNNQEIYDQYNKIITQLVNTLEIPTDTSKEYENIFTNMLKSFEFLTAERISNYKTLANTDSKPIRAYDTLTREQQKAYDNLLNALSTNKKEYVINSDEFTLYYEAAYEALLRDLIYFDLEFYTINIEHFFDDSTNQELCRFYFEDSNAMMFSYYDFQSGKSVLIDIEFSEEERKIFSENVDNILNNMPENLSILGKYKYLSDSLCEICDYAHEELEKENTTKQKNSRIHSMIGCLVDGRAVCDGYAWAYYYLCLKEGLFCNFIDGHPKELDSGHAFNYISLGNEYYFVDVTWADEENNDSYFAFFYDKEIENEHNIYIEYWNDIEIEEKSLFNDLMNNLGTIDWNNIIN